jgi:enamidase
MDRRSSPVSSTRTAIRCSRLHAAAAHDGLHRVGLNGGITTMISAGEVHLPGRPKGHRGPEGARIVAAKAYGPISAPRGERCTAARRSTSSARGRRTSAEMARGGVKAGGRDRTRLGQDGQGRAAPMVRWAKQHGMTVTNSQPAGLPSHGLQTPIISAEGVREARSPTRSSATSTVGPPVDERARDRLSLVRTSKGAREIVDCGNARRRSTRSAGATDARGHCRIVSAVVDAWANECAPG